MISWLLLATPTPPPWMPLLANSLPLLCKVTKLRTLCLKVVFPLFLVFLLFLELKSMLLLELLAGTRGDAEGDRRLPHADRDPVVDILVLMIQAALLLIFILEIGLTLRPRGTDKLMLSARLLSAAPLTSLR